MRRCIQSLRSLGPSLPGGFNLAATRFSMEAYSSSRISLIPKRIHAALIPLALSPASIFTLPHWFILNFPRAKLRAKRSSFKKPSEMSSAMTNSACSPLKPSDASFSLTSWMQRSWKAQYFFIFSSAAVTVYSGFTPAIYCIRRILEVQATL